MANQIQIVGQPTAQDVNDINETLFRFKSVFPFELFPDEVILDRFKINIVKNDFIASGRIISIPLSGTVDVKVNKGPFMSAIEIQDPSVGVTKTTIRYVKTADALKFHEMVEGIVVGIRQGVNLNNLSKPDLIKSSKNWGSVDVGS